MGMRNEEGRISLDGFVAYFQKRYRHHDEKAFRASIESLRQAVDATRENTSTVRLIRRTKFIREVEIEDDVSLKLRQMLAHLEGRHEELEVPS